MTSGTIASPVSLKDLPKYAFHRLDVVTSWPTTYRRAGDRRTWEGWSKGLFGPKCFVKLPEGFDPAGIELHKSPGLTSLYKCRAFVSPEFLLGSKISVKTHSISSKIFKNRFSGAGVR